MYSDFVFLDQFLFELSCKNTHTHTHKHGRTHTHRDSNEYSIVAFSKNATIIKVYKQQWKLVRSFGGFGADDGRLWRNSVADYMNC